MSENLKDILSHLSASIDQDTLLKYLQGKLSDEQRHEVEKKMLDADFENDAMEGLQDLKDKQKISVIVGQLNRDLKKKLEQRKRRTGKMTLQAQPWLYITLVVILVLIILAYFVIHNMLRKG